MTMGRGGRSQPGVVNVANVGNSEMYVQKKLSVVMKDGSCLVMIKTSSFLLHPVPLYVVLRLLLVGVYLLPLMLVMKLSSSYCTYLGYFH